MNFGESVAGTSTENVMKDSHRGHRRCDGHALVPLLASATIARRFYLNLFMRIYLAPMEGVVDHHLRRLYAGIGGIDLCVTEFVRVTQTRLPEKVFRRYCPELAVPLPIPVRIQLLGSDPALLAVNARKAARLGAPGVDLNFGCPAKTVNKNRGGACLLNEPELLYDIARRVRDAVPAATPVTAKIRLGYESRSRYIENALALAEGGVAELVVHGRSKADGYRPPAYWGCIGEIRARLAIPVIANGDIWSPEDYRQCREESGCEHVMLGRGLLSRPDLALAIRADQAQADYRHLSWSCISDLLLQFQRETTLSYPKQFCGNRLKQWLMYLLRHYPQAGQLFEIIKKTRDPQVIEAAIVAARRLAA
jgi:tRNA-dihydrouridine synthase C